MYEKLVYSEVFAILNLLEDEYRGKIPENFNTFLKKNKDNNYTPIYNKNVPLLNQNIQRGTIAILNILYLVYWCKNQNEKEEILNNLNSNAKLYESKLQNNSLEFSSANILNNYENSLPEITTKKETSQLIEKEYNFIQKILNKIIYTIKNIFNNKGDINE